MRKYSCSAPAKDTTAAGSSCPKSRRTLSAWRAMACWERRSGVFESRASPVIETNTVGMHRVVPLELSRR